ncbi:MAG TPA: hypothetical protein VGG78_06190 [Gemmatimonadaceae bacterium]|jgi:hypothetical protein
MSDSAQPDVAAFRELEMLVRHLGDELAGFRRRALLAEARLRELDSKSSGSSTRAQQRDLADRCANLEEENAALRTRVDVAAAQARQMLDRVRFIRQQTQGGAGAGSDR